ncbi:MAG: amino acid adenylation protein [Pedosphaera sp.]|nr:amino acid adenylation protein [Pedosphaera sp.]
MNNHGAPIVREEVAIIGLAGRFPGAANVDEFWRNICDRVESVRSFSAEELAASGIDPAVLKDPRYVNRGVVLEEADSFDAAFFGYHPREVELMDPQHRVFLECAWAALEHAGYDPEEYDGLIGVYGGVARNHYLVRHLLPRQDLLKTVGTHQMLIANEKDFPATRVSFKLNLRGPSLNVQSACSSSGVAIHLACQSLLGGECDMALAGGACIRFPLTAGYFYEEGGIQSPDGHCRAFDAQAQGTVFGSGVAMIVLKRLTDALRDHDFIHAIIKGTAINNDGSGKVGFTAPGVEGQARAITEAQAMAGIDAETIGYIEAHGTGTSLGDPIEIAALTRAFRQSTAKKGFCAIGSVKTNIGHMDAGAGAVGVIKTVLALQHRQFPPSLNFEKPNPEIDFANSPFFVNTKLTEWKSGETPRRAGVSSFGLGGTNAHIILEEAPISEPSGPYRSSQLLLLSARTGSAREQTTGRLAKYLEQHPEANLADVAYTLQTGRRAFTQRRFVVCRDSREAADLLTSSNPKRVFSGLCGRPNPPITFMFPGQGAQQVNMALELFQTEPTFRKQIDACAEIFKRHLGLDLREVIYPACDDEIARQRINQTLVAQPALFAVEFALAQLWMQWGIHPQNMIGHSLGEYVAACLAGVFSLEDVLMLLARRGRLMQDLPGGAMLAVSLTQEEIQPFLGGHLSLAAVNSKSNCVISGPNEAMVELEQRFANEKISCRHLSTSHAFHSTMVEPVLEPFLAEVQKVRLNPPQIPFISSPSGTWITAAQATDPAYWARHMRETVHFDSGLREIFKGPEGILLEVGPVELLGGFARRLSRETSSERLVLASLSHASGQRGGMDSLLHALGHLWLAGAKVDWNGFHQSEKRYRVALPTYPFERRRYWIDPPAYNNQAAAETTSAFAEGNRPASIPAINNEVTSTAAQEIRETQVVPTQSKTSMLPNRKGKIIAGLGDILHDLSGIEMAAISPDATFLSLGLDSLFLTQAGLAFHKKFAVRITLNHLLQEYPSIETLADYIDHTLPPVSEPEVQITPIESPAPNSDYKRAMEEMLQQQIQFMSRQLTLLRDTPANGNDGRTPEVDASVHNLNSNGRNSQTPPAARPMESGQQKENRWFGPFKPIDKDPDRALNAQQGKALEELIARYTQRTRESRRLTQVHRSHLADPRTVSGFRLLWKEMVYPIVAPRSAGSKIWDVDGNEYVDFTMGYGIHLFGHSPKFVTEALAAQLKQGIQIGPQSPLAGEVAAALCSFTGLERVTFCNTGSESVLAALRAARTVTGRNRVALFAGSYHGINDEVLVRSHKIDGVQRLLPVAPGILPNIVENALVLDYGDPESLKLLETHANEVAAVLVEPVQSRRPDFQPREFLHQLRDLTLKSGSALIFDEVITGFRLHPGGAQAWYGIQADLATYGKVIGGGLPMGAVAGQARFMDAFDGGGWNYGDNSLPGVGVTFFAGTFVRHPLALRASAAVLEHLQQSGPQLQAQLNEKSSRFARALNDTFNELEAPLSVANCGSMFYFRFAVDQPFGNLLFYYLREKGVHIWEGRPCFLSTAHTDEDLDFLLRAFRESVIAMRANGFLSQNPAAPTPSGINKATDTVKDAGSEHRVPLTPAQMEIWLEAQKGDHASCRYNESTTINLRGSFNAAAMREALQALVNRHEALRTVFSSQGEYQKIQPQLQLEVTSQDLSAMASEERDMRVAELQLGEGRIPFDLANGPLVRAQIVRLAEQHHLLLLTLHHIICDGWSLSIIFKDLGELYTSADQRAGMPLAPAMKFSEYVARQSTPAQTSETAQSETYWLDRLSGSLPVVELPTDLLRPAVKGYNGKRVIYSLPPALYSELKRWSGQINATLFTTLLAGFEILVHRLTGQNAVLIGIPVSCQAQAGGGDLVGHCTNLLPVRSDFQGRLKLTDFIALARREVLNVCDHQHCTFSTLLQKLNLSRDPSRAPLLPVTFNVDRVLGLSNFSNLTVTASPNPKSYLNFDLSLNVRDNGSTLQLECDFDTDLFHAETIERWLAHYQTVLEAMIKDPERLVSELPLLKPAELQQLLVEWNQTQTDYPQKTIPELFDEQAAQTPDAIAVAFGNRQVTYGELNVRANQLANYLKECGIGADKLVGLCIERSLEMIVALLGILKAGGAYVALDPKTPMERLRFMLEDARPSVILVQSKLRQAAIELAMMPLQQESRVPLIVCLESDARNIGRQSTGNPASMTTPASLAYVCFTSGSTGRPKGVSVPHHGVVRLIRNTNYISLSATDIFLQFAPLSFDASTFEIWGCLLNGAQLVVFPPHLSSLAELGTFIRKRRVSVLWLTAGLFHQMVEQQLKSLRGVRKLLAGGDVLSVTHVRKALASLGEGRLLNGYGPTENTTFTCCHPITQASVAGHAIPIGRPISNTQCFILDQNLQPVPVGVRGELFTAGDGLADGYLNDQELTGRKFISNPFSRDPKARLYRTGDLARYLPDGNIEFLGRADLLVKIRGFRVELGEIEAVLQQHPGVRECVAIVREDVAAEKQLIAYFTTQREPVPANNELRAFLKEKLPDYMVPSVFMCLKSMPLTANGKVDRSALPVPDGKRSDLETGYLPPRNAVEVKLVGIWESLLGMTPIGIRDNFFDLGGHSLLAVRMFSRIEMAFGRRIPLTALFRTPTIEHIADMVRQQEGFVGQSLLVAIQEKGSKPPLFLVHGAGGGMLWGYTNLAMHLHPDQPVYGIESRGMQGQKEFGRIEEMAAHYIAELRALQPNGPYFLGGYCFGGNVAYEMARQLHQRQESVAMVALFEASPIQGSYDRARWWRPRFAFDFLQNVFYWLRYLARLEAGDRRRIVRRRIRSVMRGLIWRLRHSPIESAPIDLDAFVDVSQIPESELKLWRDHLRAMEGQASLPYAGRVTLFRTQRQPLWCSFDPKYGWHELAAGGVDVRMIPGAHETIFMEPNVRVTAAQLQACLDEVQTAKITVEVTEADSRQPAGSNEGEKNQVITYFD